MTGPALVTEPYPDQARAWPRAGRHILAQFDAETVVVYQAYRPAIGRFAAEHGTFGGDFRYARMSWVKPNFLWMMARSGWGTKQDQEVTLGLRVRRVFFDSLLAAAVPSSWDAESFATREEWSHAVTRSSVRLQWDPDHRPRPSWSGAPSNWGYGARRWRRSGGGSWSRSPT